MNPPSKTYQITLTPLGSFFFGGEVVFGEPSEGEHRRRSYLVHSAVLPQQTSLLGMLREQLLRQNGELLAAGSSSAEVTAAMNRVGETSFGWELLGDAPPDNARPRYGCIQEISPLKIVRDGMELDVAPLDDVLGKKGAAADYNPKADSPYLQNFDPKDGLFHGFQSAAVRVATEDLFPTESRVGITVTNRKNWRTAAKDKEAFYRQSSYRNAATVVRPAEEYPHPKASPPPVAFRFWARLASPLHDTIVTLGGERSTFRMEVENQKEASWEKQFTNCRYNFPKAPPPGHQRIVLTSDAYLDPATLKSTSTFAVATTVPFRFFSTTLGSTTNYYDVGDRKTKSLRRQSKGYHLLQRGSVLYVPAANLPALEKALLNESAFRTIGYNHFVRV